MPALTLNDPPRSLGRRLTADEWLAGERDSVDFRLAVAAELDARRRTPRDDLLPEAGRTG